MAIKTPIANYGGQLKEIQSGDTIAASLLGANLSSLAGLSYSATAFVKMTGAGTFSLDTTTYLDTTTAASTYVPYNNANADVDLNNFHLVNVAHLGVGTNIGPDIIARFVGNNNPNSRITMRGYSNNSSSSGVRVAKYRGTYASPSPVQSGDSLGTFQWGGYDGTTANSVIGATIEAVTTENWSSNHNGTILNFYVTPTGTATSTLAITLDQSAGLTIYPVVSSSAQETFYSAGSVVGGQINSYHSRGTISSPTASLANDRSLEWWGYDYDGTQYVNNAGITFKNDGIAPSGGASNGRIDFYVGDGSVGLSILGMSLNSSKALSVVSTVSATDAILSNITGGYLVTSTSVTTDLLAIDDTLHANQQTGFYSWGGSGSYWSNTGGTFTLLRPGTGYIQGKKITWAGSQSITIPTNTCPVVCIDNTGTISVQDETALATYRDYIPLYLALYDGSQMTVSMEHHVYGAPPRVVTWDHETIGSVLTGSGAVTTRVTTGTGGVATDRQLKIVGADTIYDLMLTTAVPDSGGSAVTWDIYHTDVSGHWVRGSQAATFPMQYNNAGTLTSLATSGSNSFGVFNLYAAKANDNSSSPVYIAVMDHSAYNNLGTATTAVNNGTIAMATNELERLQIVHLGYIIVQNNVSGGFINTVIVARSVIGTNLAAAGNVNSAALITVNTSSFANFFSAADTTVQNALNTIDSRLIFASGKTLTMSNSLTFAGTDGSTLNIGTGGTLGALAYGSWPSTGIPISTGSAWVTSITESDGYVVYGSGGVWTKSNNPTLAGLTVSGITTISGTDLFLSGRLKFNVGGTASTNLRWNIQPFGTETGSNVGSDLAIFNYSDTGVFINQPFTITRSTGAVSMPGSVSTGALTVTGLPTFNNDHAELRKDYHGVTKMMVTNLDMTTSDFGTQVGYWIYGTAGYNPIGSLKWLPALNSAAGALYLTTEGNYPIWFGINASATPSMTIATTGIITMSHYGAGTTTFDASGNIGSFVATQSVVTGTRAIGTVYQNSGTRPMLVTFTQGGAVASYTWAYTDASNPPTTIIGATSNTGGGGTYGTITFMVLPGNFYKITNQGGSPTVVEWTEWAF